MSSVTPVRTGWNAIRARGFSCETIVGETPGAEREALIAAFKRGDIRCLTNANVLTTGFNAPGVDLLAMLRPTKSAGLYVQIVGRGCRLAPGKANCLVLDFAGMVCFPWVVAGVRMNTLIHGEAKRIRRFICARS